MSYRKIYESYYGEILKGFHIHHIDGNKENNNIENLQCVSPIEHYNIHKRQGDYGACWALMVTGHIDLSLLERSELVSNQMNKMVKLGKHPWQKQPDGSSFSKNRSEDISKIVKIKQRELVENGKHHLLSSNRNSDIDIKKSKTLCDKYKDPEFKEYMRQNSLNRTWKLDKETAIKVSKHLVKYTSETADVCKNTIWINNGIINKRIKNNKQIPEGFVQGRLFIPWNKKGL
jgi:hypothetical protein